MTLPVRAKDLRRFFDSMDMSTIEASVATETRARLVIVGPVNSGKSTLFNELKGQKLSEASAVPGTTRSTISEDYGPFTLLDTPGLGEVAGEETTRQARTAIDRADVAILVLDAMAGIRQDDADLYADLRAQGLPVVVALNKIDLLKKDLDRVVKDAERKLRVPMIPISAKKGTNVADQLIPAVIDAHPQMAVTIGRALPRYRKVAARRVIRESSFAATAIGAEPIPAIEIPLLIGIQVRMLLRIAAIFGQKLSVSSARELITAIAGGAFIRYATQELVKFIPGPGWIIAGIVAGTGTNAIGNAAIIYFEQSQNLNPEQLRALYKRIRRRKNVPQELGDGQV